MGLKEKIEEIKAEMSQMKVQTTEELEAFRIKFLGSKNIIKGLYQELKEVPNELKKEFGQHINALKQEGEKAFEQFKATVGNDTKTGGGERIDLSRPAEEVALG